MPRAAVSALRGCSVEDLPRAVHHVVEVDSLEAVLVGLMSMQLLDQNRLGERAEHEAVVGGDDMHGAPLHDEAHHLAVEEEFLEFGGIEVHEP